MPVEILSFALHPCLTSVGKDRCQGFGQGNYKWSTTSGGGICDFKDDLVGVDRRQ